jgi:hypothetical protein
LLDRAGLDPHDVAVFLFNAQLQRPTAVQHVSLRQRHGQQGLNVDAAVAAAQQMLLEERPYLLGRFEFLFFAYCACSAQQ